MSTGKPWNCYYRLYEGKYQRYSYGCTPGSGCDCPEFLTTTQMQVMTAVFVRVAHG
jgi:hypothetical protein